MSTNTSATSTRPTIAIHWFRKGLRLHDNPSLLSSLSVASNCPSGNGEFYPVYVLDGDCYQLRHCSALRANFLVECLSDLDASLRERGSRLYVASGDPAVILPDLWTKWGVMHMSYESDETGEPYATDRDEKVMAAARENGVEVTTVATETLHPLDAYVKKAGGSVGKVPTSMGSFQTLLSKLGQPAQPEAAPTQLKFPPSQNHDEWEGRYLPPLKPTDLPWPRDTPKSDVTPLWGPSDCENLTPLVKGGETHALASLKNTCKRSAYVASFEKPKTSCTSLEPSTTALSPYLSIGCISPRTVWHALSEAKSRAPASTLKSKPPVSLHGQMMWRDFNNLIAHAANKQNPGSWGHMDGNPYCRHVPWIKNDKYLAAWKEGKTGYPWIDACLAQLRTEGWIHHLGRHAVACFLTRGDLWQSWEDGAHHFETELLDADYALNNFNWLWLSCSGFFYQYFRCYSPVAFQKKNDPHGAYIRKWLPVLAQLPDKFIYEPWKAPMAVQKAAGIKIGVDYPRPIVDHAAASKENMEKMSYAYQMHKDRQAGGKKQVALSGASSRGKVSGKGGKVTGDGEPVKKKRRKQSKLSF